MRRGKAFEAHTSSQKIMFDEGSPEIRRMASGRRWIAPTQAAPKPWAALWPVLFGGECIACWALGPKVQKASRKKEEDQIMELVCARTAFWLEQRGLWNRLESANRQATLGWLLGAVVHEIRNPLAALNTFVQLMPQKGGDKEFLQSFHRVASKEIERLNGLTGNLLDFLKTEPEKLKKTDLRQLVDHAADLAQPLFRSKKVELKIQVSKPLLVNGNEGQLESLVFNLLQNAFSAAGAGGWIAVAGELRRDKAKGGPFVLLQVKDNGKGISKEELGLIFNSFYSSTKGGSGLGLAICQKIVSNHGGRLEVKSRPGKGSVFSVYLPSWGGL